MNILTIIKVIDKEEILEKSLDEILKSKIYQQNKVELIILDLLQTEKTKKILKEKNLVSNQLKIAKNRKVTEAYQLGKEKAKGNFVNFSRASTFIEGHVLTKVYNSLNSEECIMLDPHFYSLDSLKHEANYIKKASENFEKTNEVSIENNKDLFNPLLDSYFFNKNIVKELSFDSKILEYADIKFILDALSLKKEYQFWLDKCHYTEELENDFNNFSKSYDKSWYLDFVEKFALPYIKNNNNLWVQNTILYLISMRYASNMNARNKNVLTEKQLEKFEENVNEILKYIDDDVFNYFHNSYVSKVIIEMFIKMKYKDNIEIAKKDNTIVLKQKDSILMTLEKLSIDVMCLEFYKDSLNFDIEIVNSIFINDKTKINVYVNDELVKYTKNEVYTYTKFFNKIRHQKYTFHLKIAKEILNENAKIYFEYEYDDVKIKLPITFKHPLSKINTNLNHAYYSFSDFILTYNDIDQEINIENKTNWKVVKREIGLLSEFLLKSENKKLGIKSFGLRVLYWITKPFYRKPVWITFDKLFKAGDNGEYFYQYAIKQDDGINKYYVINRDSLDYKRLKTQKGILKFRSIKHYLMVLNCDIMFATHANPFDYNGYTKGVEKYFRDKLNFHTACLQHGLSVNQIAKFQNRVYANTKLYFCASKYEIENLSLKEYDYIGYDALKLTGVARYDGLKNNDKKIILITPTWRQSSSSKLVKLNMARQYNSDFKNGIYYKIYNDLINDKKLLSTAKKYGYRIVYLLHPAVSSQLKDFVAPEGVKVIAATSDMSYEKILTESSLMITDYSGVQFDFAYMRKPILYYHPEELPPHYEESRFKYESMGFGPILKKHNEIVENICTYIEKGCIIDPKYSHRADDFFEYSDHKSAERIYKEAKKFQNELRK